MNLSLAGRTCPFTRVEVTQPESCPNSIDLAMQSEGLGRRNYDHPRCEEIGLINILPLTTKDCPVCIFVLSWGIYARPNRLGLVSVEIYTNCSPKGSDNSNLM